MFRPKEHGDKANEYNENMYRAAYSALHNGECLAIAPEGVSRFAANMAQPLKTGPARIALKALDLAKDQEDFQVKIAPVGITYTHREKFRSSVLLRFSEPIVVDRSWLPPDSMTDPMERDEYFRKRSKEITEKIGEALIKTTIHSPDFETGRLAMTATRVLLPLGTNISLDEYISLIRQWVHVLKDEKEERIAQARNAIHSYQAILDEKRVKDERVRRYAFDEGGRPSRAPRILLVSYRVLVFLVLCILVVPGLLVWSPVWWYLRRRERQVLAKGPNWNDSVTEMKISSVFMFLMMIPIGFGLDSMFMYIWAFLIFRLYEEVIAAGRSLYSHYKFYFLYDSTLAEMLRRRRIAVYALREIAHDVFDPNTVPESFFKSPLRLGRDTVIRVWPWENWSITRRRKKDWNETLRFEDYNTMDYFEGFENTPM